MMTFKSDNMEKRNARRTREIVVPGEVLADASDYRAGENAYELDGKIRANVMGTKTFTDNAVGVTVMGGFYMPVTGDTVIGIINDVGPSNWMLDINAPYPAPLHVSEVPWKVEFGDTSRFLTVGDVVLLKVLMVDESKKIQVTMKDSGLRKIMTDCRIFVGQNGRIWIDGDDENVDVAAEAIRIIEAESRSANLTDRVREFIEKKLPQSEEEDDEEDFE